MAIPPTIPTSFVPKQPVQTTQRARTGMNVFMLVSFVLAGLALLGTAGVFGYEKYLESAKERKAEELRAAEASISRDTVEEFIRLRDRFASSERLLDEHVTLSQFFDLLESVTLQSVSFTSLDVEVNDDRSATIGMTGVADSFNALAAESAAFAGEKRIRRAIFSDIGASATGGGVSFSLQAELDPRLVVWDTTIPVSLPSDTAPVTEPVVEDPAAPTQ